MGYTVRIVEVMVAFNDGNPDESERLGELREALVNTANEFISNNPDDFYRDEVL